MTAMPLVAALAWTAALVASSGPFSPAAALLAGIGVLSMSSVSVVGMTLTGGRWAHRLAIGSVAAGLVIAVMRPIDGFWVLGLILSALAGAILFIPSVRSRIRRLPAASGPPQTAVLAAVMLLTAPFLIGVAFLDTAPWAGLIIGLSAPIAAFLFSRVVPGGLLSIRLGWPLVAVGLAPFVEMPAAAVSAGLGLAVALIAWRPEVKTSFHPPRETGTTYPIPPELAPGDILDAARIDERGRRE